MPSRILTNTVASITELKTNPMATVKAAGAKRSQFQTVTNQHFTVCLPKCSRIYQRRSGAMYNISKSWIRLPVSGFIPEKRAWGYVLTPPFLVKKKEKNYSHYRENKMLVALSKQFERGTLNSAFFQDLPYLDDTQLDLLLDFIEAVEQDELLVGKNKTS